MIIYGGNKEQVEGQLTCEHDWHGPCMDDEYRYFKCKKCHCVDRDTNEAEDDPLDHHLNKFVRQYFNVLNELGHIRARRNDALRIIEEKREEIYAIEQSKDAAIADLRAQAQQAGDNAAKWLNDAAEWTKVARGIFVMFQAGHLGADVMPKSLEGFMASIKCRLEEVEGLVRNKDDSVDSEVPA